MENVLGIRRHLPAISADLQTRGYHSDVLDIEAADLGVPQNRRRLFIIGIRDQNFLTAEAFFDDIRRSIQKSARRSMPVVLADALLGLPSVAAKTAKNSTAAECREWGYSISHHDGHSNKYLDQINLEFGAGPLFNHRSKYNNARDVNLFSRMKPGDDSMTEGVAALNPYRNRDHIFKDKFYRLRPDRPCKTITAHMYYDCNMYIHPVDHRGLTPREAARVQGFPDQYVFTGTPNEWYRQIGNGVSPLVARHLARAVLQAMDRYGIKA
jgi:DNA (cytosine-5)-methyltransferase 1